MGWFKKFFRSLGSARPTEIPLLASGDPDEKRMIALAQRPLDSETESICRRLFRLQQYTLAEMVEGNPMRVIIVRTEVKGLLKSEFGVDISNTEDAEAEIRKVGTHLCEKGGFARMVFVAHRVAALGGSIRQLEFSWDGICGWRH